MDIKVTGIELLDEKEKETFNKISNEFSNKIKRKIKNDFSLKFFIKEHSKGGKTKKFSIDVEAISFPHLLKSTAYDWDFAKALRKALEKIITEAEHKFHASEQGRESGLKKNRNF